MDLNKPYNPGIAELGKFVEVVAPSDSTYGKYAILTYSVCAQPVSLSAVNVKNWDTLIGSTGTTPLSVVVIESETDNLFIGSKTLSANELYNVTPPTTLTEIEIQNKTGDTIYYLPSAVSDAATLSSKGIELDDDVYYSFKRNIGSLTVLGISAGDVKILGYY